MDKFITFVLAASLAKERYCSLFSDSKAIDAKMFESNPEDVSFFLYPPPANSEPIEIRSDDKNSIDFSKPIKILIHGWSSSATNAWIIETARTYHETGDFNILAVDWTKDAAKSFIIAALALQSVGYTTGSFISNLTSDNLESLANVHLIGHSFGAHVSGFAGQFVRDLGGERVGRITGLDPAGPMYNGRPDDLKLSKDDADFVDVIHTNMARMGGVGTVDRCGSVDFYPNEGGPIQPDCLGEKDPVGCSHMIAMNYFENSIAHPAKYEGVICPNLLSYRANICDSNPRAFMGEHVDRNVSGKVYLKTE